jgi:hypothetical protein
MCDVKRKKGENDDTHHDPHTALPTTRLVFYVFALPYSHILTHSHTHTHTARTRTGRHTLLNHARTWAVRVRRGARTPLRQRIHTHTHTLTCVAMHFAHT